MATPTWTELLDRLEERLRRIEASTRLRPGEKPPDLGPEPGSADRPEVAPTPDERLRLLALLEAHHRLESRLEARRRTLQRARHYHGTA
jgi:hypothetical protein